MTAQPTDIDGERGRLIQSLWAVLGTYNIDLPEYPTLVLRHVLDPQRGSILYTHHGHLYRVTLTVTAED